MLTMMAPATVRHSKEFKTNIMNNDDDNIPAAAAADDDESMPTTATTTMSDITGLLQRTTTTATAAPVSIEKSLASLELQYFKAVSLYRRRNYEKCVEVCNAMLQAGHENNVQMFNTPPDQEGEEEADGEEAANPRQSNYNISAEQQPPGILSNVYHTGGGGGWGGSNISNNSSSSAGNNVQRYSSNLQRMGAIKGRQQRGIYGNNVNSSSNITNSATTTGSASSSSFTTSNSNLNSSWGHTGATSSSSSSFSVMPTWMMEGVWQLKMRALTQRIYIDDLETNDADDAGM